MDYSENSNLIPKKFPLFWPSAFLVLQVSVRPCPEEEIRTVSVAQGDGVEESRAAVVVLSVDLRTAQGQECVQAILVTPRSGTVESRESLKKGWESVRFFN